MAVGRGGRIARASSRSRCGARVRLRGEVSSETLRQVIELLR
jgi:hypothetical protein